MHGMERRRTADMRADSRAANMAVQRAAPNTPAGHAAPNTAVQPVAPNIALPRRTMQAEPRRVVRHRTTWRAERGPAAPHRIARRQAVERGPALRRRIVRQQAAQELALRHRIVRQQAAEQGLGLRQRIARLREDREPAHRPPVGRGLRRPAEEPGPVRPRVVARGPVLRLVVEQEQVAVAEPPTPRLRLVRPLLHRRRSNRFVRKIGRVLRHSPFFFADAKLA